MKPKITPQKVRGRSGWYALVELQIEPREHVTIFQNRLLKRNIIDPYDGYAGVNFGDIYKEPNHTKLIPVDGSVPLDRFIALLDQGCRSFQKLISQAAATIPRAAPRPPEPFMFYEAHRFRHQTVQGNSGSGKTTFLTNLILGDMDKVANGDASIVILDSQNRDLTKDLPRMSCFAPGGDLEGKLVYLQHTLRHPLAFNIFARGSSFCDFVLRSLVGADISVKQNVPYRYLLYAASLIPKATIYTVQQLLRDGGMKILNQHLQKASPNDQQWYRKNWNADNFQSTKQELLYRFESLTTPGDDNVFRETLTCPDNKINIAEHIQAGKVVIINTVGLSNYTRPMGRLFIYQILEAVGQRAFMNESDLMPTYFYIDEAAEYITDDDSIPDLLERARKQKIALIMAYQRTGPGAIKSANVREALAEVFIQTRLLTPGTGTVMLKDGRGANGANTSREVEVADKHFSDYDEMTDAQWNAILAEMHAKYSWNPNAKPQGKKRPSGASPTW